MLRYNAIKGELGELEFYFRKIPLHQQKFLVVSVEKFEKWIKIKLLSTFCQAMMHVQVFLYLLRDDMN